MTPQPAQQQLAHLRALADALPALGLTAEISGTETATPYLRAARAEETALRERITCRSAGGAWEFCWPWGQAIGPAGDPAAAAATIAGVLRPAQGTP